MSHMPSNSPTTVVVANGESSALVPGTPVYPSGPLTGKRAIATSLLTATVIALIDQNGGIAVGATGTAQSTGGFVTLTTAEWDAVCGTSGGLTFGRTYYLSAAVAGMLTSVPPVGAGQYLEPVLVGISPTVGLVMIGVPQAIGAASAVTGTGTTNSMTKYTGSATLGNSQITDDGTTIRMANLCLVYTDLGVLGSVVDLDLTAYSTSAFKFTPALGGTTIRSIKTKSTVAGTGAGQMIWLFNAGNSALPGDYLSIFTQDDGSALYQHIHLEGRQPWASFPALSVVGLRLDDATSKWHLAVPGDFSQHPRPIPITFNIATGNQNDIAPVDGTTGLNGRYAQWFRCIPVGTTKLCGIEASAPTGGSNWSRRILLTNYGASCTIVHNNGGGGTSTYPFFCPGGVDYTWRLFASVWVTFDEGNHTWMVEGP